MIPSNTYSRPPLALLVLFSAGVLLPFTTRLHNICLPQTAAAELIPLAGLLVLLLSAVFRRGGSRPAQTDGRGLPRPYNLARTPLLKPLLACLAVLLLTGLLAEFHYAAAEQVFTTKAPRHQVRPET